MIFINIQTLQILFIILLTSPALTYGDVYKWVDEEGKVHYGDNPPIDSTKEELKVEGNISNENEYNQQQRENREKLLNIYEEERLEKQKVREVKREIFRQNKKRCESLKTDLIYNEQISGQENVVLFEKGEDGKPVEVDRDKWDLQLEELRKEVKKCCDNQYITCK